MTMTMTIPWWLLVVVIAAGVVVLVLVAAGAALVGIVADRRDRQADTAAPLPRPGGDDQFRTWPALRVPEKQLVVLCAGCTPAVPVSMAGQPGIAGRFCPACIDACHDATEPGHTCPVCAKPPASEGGGAL